MEQNFVILLCRNVGYKEQVQYLKDQSESKSKTISFVSHEFRTPLNCIITMLQQNKDEMEEQFI
jgi:signal transduction histidine kinase